MSNVFRFHAPGNTQKESSLGLLKKRKPKSDKFLVPIGADTSSITDSNGKRPIDSFRFAQRKNYITLTRKESDLISIGNPGEMPPLVLEEMHPWLPLQMYRENSIDNFRSLNRLLKKYGNFLIDPGFFCDKKWNTICNSIRQKTDHDARFYSAWHLPIQDTFLLKESRPDRRVIALDFNAMYASCMQYDFPKPSTLYHIDLNRDLLSDELLSCGLYRCFLHPPASSFIRKYNPFRSFFAGRYLGASLDEPLCIDLNEFEIDFFRRHFGRIELVDAVISEKIVPHPLAREARRSHSRRKHYLSHGNKALADREKFLMTLLSSSSHRPKIMSHKFTSRTDAEKYLKEKFGVALERNLLAGDQIRWMDGRKGLTLNESAEFTTVKSPSVRGGSACFEFNQRVVARSRILLLLMMERLTQSHPDIDICYVNIDSIHFSVPAYKHDAIMHNLRSESSSQLGSFKIEASTKCGIWLEPGRYWLFSEKLVRSRNRGISRRRSPFSDHSIYVAVRKIGDLYIPIRIAIGMERSMSDARMIIDDGHADFARQRILEFGESSSLNDILEGLERNRIEYIPKRIKLFRDLREKLQ